MPRRPKNEPVPPDWDSEVNLLAWLATCVSVISLLFYFRHAEILLYGDAIAHINIARRVFDSKTPGLLQLGTVWLPLPHLLMIPFLISNRMWQQGIGGSVPSMVAYVFATIGIFRLTRGTLSRTAVPDGPSRTAAWIAAAIFAANPNLIYMQTTAMGESLYLAFFIWSIVYFSEWMRGDQKALIKCGLCLTAACLTRYDGWFLAVAMAGVACLRALFASVPVNKHEREGTRARNKIRSSAVKFVFLVAVAPTLWLSYNGIIYRNPLEFENGPYSAKAIERRSQTSGTPGHPGSGNPVLAGMYFVKSAEANIARNEWLQRAWILVCVAAIGIAVYYARLRRAANAEPVWWPLVFLLIPLPFYALSIAYGGVPIFVPCWWPFTHYNVRYGLQLLPAFAVGFAILANLVLRTEDLPVRARVALAFGVVVFVAASYISIWQTPICLAEAQINMRTRNQLQVQLSAWLSKLPPDSTLLMYVGDHVGAAERAGLPLKRTINEGNHRVWMQPTDSEGLWERALANPSQYADYVLAFEGDPVWQAIQDRHLRELVDIHVTGQPRAILYRAR